MKTFSILKFLLIILSLHAQDEFETSSEFLLKTSFKINNILLNEEISESVFQQLLTNNEIGELYLEHSDIPGFSCSIKWIDDSQKEIAFYVYRGDAVNVVCVQAIHGYNVSNHFFKQSIGQNWIRLALIARLNDFLAADANIWDSEDRRQYLIDYRFYPEEIIAEINERRLGEEVALDESVSPDLVDVEHLIANFIIFEWSGNSLVERVEPNSKYRPLYLARSVKSLYMDRLMDFPDCADENSFFIQTSLIHPCEPTSLDSFNIVWNTKKENQNGIDFIEVHFLTRSSVAYHNFSYAIVNGYSKSDELWISHNRIKRLKVFKNAEPFVEVLLQDTFKPQTFSINPPGLERISLKEGDRIRFEISETYPGNKNNVTFVSHFAPLIYCDP